ncbi:copper homeostasis membrane protein CopD [Erwinia tracheiphila]|nr:copper homeostasis membrane protein CopD [Erwinia tracheiphila]
MSFSLFYMFCRWMHFSALIALIGCSTFTVLLAPCRFREHLRKKFHIVLVCAAALTLLSTIMLLAGHTALLVGSWQDLKNVTLWQAVLQTHVGLVWQWQLFAAGAGAAAVLASNRRRHTLWLLSGIAQLVGLALIGHAAMSEDLTGAFHRANQMVHLISAAFWAGGLIPVVLLLQDVRRADTRFDALKTLMRYSRYGHIAVALVVLTGVLNVLLILGWPPESFHLYTRLLLLKSVLVAAMCLMALFNRYWLVPRFQCGDNTRNLFMLTTLMEILFSVVVLLLVSVFATL